MTRLLLASCVALLAACAMRRPGGSSLALASPESCARVDTVNAYIAALTDARLDGDRWTVPAIDAGPAGTGTTRGESVGRVAFTPNREGLGTPVGRSNTGNTVSTGGSPAGARTLEAESTAPATVQEQRAAIDAALKRFKAERATMPTDAACRGLRR
jgi:hypothetical protein